MAQNGESRFKYRAANSAWFLKCVGFKSVPVYKTDDKQNVKNYRPVSLLPIFGKVFERLIYKEMYSFFIENDLISSNQSGFKQGDSCINQLLSITHEIYYIKRCVFRHFKGIWQSLA